MRCGKCKSPYWDRGRVNEGVENRGSAGRGVTVRGPSHETTPVERPSKPVVRVIPERAVETVEHGFDSRPGGNEEAIDLEEFVDSRLVPFDEL